MPQKKVLHIIKGLGRGGAERLLVSTIRQHSKEYSFDVVYFLLEKKHLVSDLEALGCTVTCLPSSSIVSMIINLPALVKLIRSKNYNLLHAHLPWSGIMARVAGKITSVPVVYSEHNVFNRYNIITRIFSKLTYAWQAQVIAVSDRVATVLREEVSTKIPIRVISNGVDVEEFTKSVGKGQKSVGNPMANEGGDQWTMDNGQWRTEKELVQFYPSSLPKKNIIIGTVTALTAQKRIDRWLRIAAKVLAQRPEVYFMIVGDGVLRAELELKGKALVEAYQLRFAGQSSEPHAWLNGFDIFLMSSDFEGLPVALLEAMSMECVPVVTSVGGIPAVIEHGKNGFLYNPEDEEAAVKELLMLIGDEEKRKSIALEARKTVVERYSIVRMVAELEEVYSTILAK